MKGLAPGYLLDHVDIVDLFRPPPNQYNLRGVNLHLPLFVKSTKFRKTFFPTSVNIWNTLDQEIKDCPSISAFKNKVKLKDEKFNLFLLGKRKHQIWHAKIRMGCSGINSHLCHFLHVIDSPECPCGFACESPAHFFLNCPLYAAHRINMINVITAITDCNINIILFGDKNLDLLDNWIIFEAVHNFMEESNRFN